MLATTAAVRMYEKDSVGQLTNQDVMIELAYLAVELIPLIGGIAKLIKTGSRVLAGATYIKLLRNITIGVGAIDGVVIFDSIVSQLEAIEKMNISITEKAKMKEKVIITGIAMGLIIFIGARSAIKSVKSIGKTGVQGPAGPGTGLDVDGTTALRGGNAEGPRMTATYSNVRTKSTRIKVEGEGEGVKVYRYNNETDKWDEVTIKEEKDAILKQIDEGKYSTRTTSTTVTKDADDTLTWEDVLGKNVDDLDAPPKGYTFYYQDGKRNLRRIDKQDASTPFILSVDETGKIYKSTGSKRISVYSRFKGNLNKKYGEMPAGHERHHLVSDNVAQSHPLYKEGLSRKPPIYDIDNAENGRYLAKPGTEKVSGISDKYPNHSGSHMDWDKIVKEKANKYQQKLLQNPKYKGNLSNVPDEVLEKTYRRIEIELDLELQKIEGRLS